jgi:hypothetical protein
VSAIAQRPDDGKLIIVGSSCGTYILSSGLALQVRLDRLVLLVEVRQIRDEVLDDVGVRKRVELDIRRALGRNPAYID